MRRIPTIFLQIIIVLLGFGMLFALLWEPRLEGRNAHATLSQIYFNDPFLAYIYVASVAVFVALYHAFKVVGYVRREEIFSQAAVRAVRTIEYCALAFAGLIFAADAYLFIFVRGKDDIAGGIAMGLFLILASVIFAAAAAIFEQILQEGAAESTTSS